MSTIDKPPHLVGRDIARTLLSDEAPAIAGKTLVARRRNIHTGAAIHVYRLGAVPHGRKRPDVDPTPWLVTCRAHAYATKAADRRTAIELAAAPFGWCDGCHQIMLGDAPKVEDDGGGLR